MKNIQLKEKTRGGLRAAPQGALYWIRREKIHYKVQHAHKVSYNKRNKHNFSVNQDSFAHNAANDFNLFSGYHRNSIELNRALRLFVWQNLHFKRGLFVISDVNLTTYVHCSIEWFHTKGRQTFSAFYNFVNFIWIAVIAFSRSDNTLCWLTNKHTCTNMKFRSGGNGSIKMSEFNCILDSFLGYSNHWVS